MNNILTIWDIDKSLYNGYVIIDFGRFLELQGIFSKGYSEEMDSLTDNYHGKVISYENFAKGVYDIYGKYIADKNLFEILQLNKIFWVDAINNLYPASSELFQYLTSVGSDHAAVSGSSFESLYYLLDRLNFKKLKSTEFKTFDGNFTGEITATLVSHFDKSRLKLKVVNQKNKYNKIIGVGDNFADKSFLELVDIPIIIGENDVELINWGKENNAIICKNPNKKNQIISMLEEII